MPAEEGKPVYEYKKWQTVFDMSIYKEHFQPPEKSAVLHTTIGTLDLVAQRVSTWSSIVVLSEEKRAEFLDKTKQIIMGAEDLVWIDEKEGTFEVPFTVPIIVIRRK